MRADDPIAILGSTPELRDLLALLGFRDVYVLERNAAFLARMNGLRVRAVHRDGAAGRLDADAAGLLWEICGSALGPDQRKYPLRPAEGFYCLVAESLRPGGMFCDKLLSYPIPHEPLGELLDKYESAPLNLDTVNRFNCEVFFCSELLTTFGRVDTSRFYDYLRKMGPGPHGRCYFGSTSFRHTLRDDMGLRSTLVSRARCFRFPAPLLG